MSLETDGVWKGGIWAPTVWASGVWREGAAPPQLVGTIPDITLTLNGAATEYDLSEYFANADSYSIAPAVESGWDFNTSTGVLTVDPTALGVFGPYVVTATNVGGNTDSNGFSVTVYEEVLPQGGDDAPKRKDYSQELLERFRSEKEQLKSAIASALSPVGDESAEEAVEAVQAVERRIRNVREYAEALKAPEAKAIDRRAEILELIASTERELEAFLTRLMTRLIRQIMDEIDKDRMH